MFILIRILKKIDKTEEARIKKIDKVIKEFIDKIRKSRDCQYAKGKLPNEARVELTNYRPML